MSRRRVLLAGGGVAFLALVAAGLWSLSSADDDALVLMTHESFVVSDEVLAAFTDETGIEVDLQPAEDAGSMVNQAILTAGDPLADVLFGVDSTFLSRALEADIFLPYRSPNLDGVAEEFQADSENRVTPVDYGDVCVNYDRTFYDDSGLDPPRTLDDLTDPAHRGRLVVQNPATSSPGLAFLLATIDRFGEDGWLDYWADLRANDVVVTADWDTAYYGEFSGGTGEGDRPLVVSYATSPPAELVFAQEPIEEPTTGVLTDTCYRQVEFAGVLRGTDREDDAHRLVDFLLSRRFQEDIPLSMFVFPVVDGTALPEVFTEWAADAADPAELEPDDVDANRERWIDEWTATVVR